ncbi:MAG: plasmid recombination protein, partial [Desulfobacteraceae bacterium]|nr:plasmid recombination protein [Desulfobacteraceae bacterium]
MKAILRTAKLKSAAGVRGCAQHNSRSRFTPNADRTKQNKILVDGGPDAYETVMNHITASGVTRKVRANAVLAQEVFLSASPEYFRPDQPEAAGTWDEERMEKWRDASVSFLKKKYGDHLVDCRLHLDESTPHIHGIVVPITQGPKGPKLSAKECFGKEQLTQLQDEYPRALAHLDIERGIKGSRATHTKIQKYYGIANSP